MFIFGSFCHHSSDSQAKGVSILIKSVFARMLGKKDEVVMTVHFPTSKHQSFQWVKDRMTIEWTNWCFVCNLGVCCMGISVKLPPLCEKWCRLKDTDNKEILCWNGCESQMYYKGAIKKQQNISEKPQWSGLSAILDIYLDKLIKFYTNRFELIWSLTAKMELVLPNTHMER